MLIKINDRKYINSEKVESLRIISGESEHTVWINMDSDDSSIVFLSCDTLEDAQRAMDELATAINNANQPMGAAAGLPNGSKRCENSHAAAFL